MLCCIKKKHSKFTLPTNPMPWAMAEKWNDSEEKDIRLRIALTILAGVYDQECVLSRLRGMPHIVKGIFELATNERRWRRHIKLPDESIDKEVLERLKSGRNYWSDPPMDTDSYCFFTEVICGERMSNHVPLEFPKPTDINVNMMPFIMSNKFEESKLPSFLKPYWPLILHCGEPETNKKYSTWFRDSESQHGKICFLTIMESLVEEGKSQRRPGLHTDCPGKVKFKCKKDRETTKEGDGLSHRYLSHRWGYGGCHIIPHEDDGRGYYPNDDARMVLIGGIYMASNVEESCAVYNCKIVPNEHGEEVIGRLGDLEHLKPLLPPPQKLQANRLYWITDRTPHESLPLKEGCYRQFFRLVTSDVGLWYEDHSTKNPLGVMPDTKITKIVKGSKFDPEGVEII